MRRLFGYTDLYLLQEGINRIPRYISCQLYIEPDRWIIKPHLLRITGLFWIVLKKNVMKLYDTIRRRNGVGFILPIALFLFQACEDSALSGDTDPDPTQNNDSTQVSVTPDNILDHFLFPDSTKVFSPLPDAPATGDLKINVKDTIFIARNVKFGAGVIIKHDGNYDLDGFIVGVAGGSYHYHVPVDPDHREEITDLIQINLGFPPGSFGGDFPYTFPVTIMPLVDGIPVKEFVRKITIEEPAMETEQDPGEEPCNDIRLKPYFRPFWWVLDGIVTVKFWNGETEEYYWTDKETLKQHVYGCCESGFSTSAVEDPFHCNIANPHFIELQAESKSWVFTEALQFESDGRFHHSHGDVVYNYDPLHSNFCDSLVAYTEDDKQVVWDGTHNFQPGAEEMDIYYDDQGADNYSTFKLPSHCSLFYTCEVLVLYAENAEMSYTYVYKKFNTYTVTTPLNVRIYWFD